MKAINVREYNGKKFFTYKADEGKVFKRIADNMIFGEEITLGYTYYIGDKKLDQPKWETITDYIEVDKPIEEEQPRPEI